MKNLLRFARWSRSMPSSLRRPSWPRSLAKGRGVVAYAMALTAALALPACHRANGPKTTMRVDYSHSGTATEEQFKLDAVVLEAGEWAGNPARPIDDTNLGKYFFEVVDEGTKKVVYSRGFASIYGEWETTPEAKEKRQSFSESLRFPAVTDPVQIVLKKRDPANAFREIWSFRLDPKEKKPEKPNLPSPGALIEIEKHGPSAEKVDFLILGDGYTAAERGKFEKDARRLVDILFAHSPFRERRNDFNVWGLCPAAAESGISRPSTGIQRHSPVGATYDAFGSERYILTFENRALRDVASFAPYEFIEILTNSNTYGGGGIFNLYSTVAADSLWSPYVFIHEFGHHFAGLADEYYTSDVAYAPSVERSEPWEPNVTALRDPANLKWKELLTPGVPLPTPWSKDAFEAAARDYLKERHQIRADKRPEADMDALFTRQKEADAKLLSTHEHSAKIGAFEGALYEAKGYYRPQQDCVMFTRDEVPFCAPCRRAIEQVIDLYTRH